VRLFILRITALAAVVVSGQDLTGTWQGTFRESRVVMKVDKTASGNLTVTLYPIDQAAVQPVLANEITAPGRTLKFGVATLGATYEGRLNGDGNSITGTMTQAQPLPFDLVRATPETTWTIPPPPAAPKPMAADARLEFEVATIKPSAPDRTGRGAGFSNRRFTISNYTLLDMITFAYDIHPRQVTNIPSWAESERFDIAAQPVAEGQPTAPQLKKMLQALLADRFKLAFHRDKKELSVYAITVDPKGPKLSPSTSDQQLPSVAFRGRGNLPARNATMANLANVMQNSVLDRPVLDQTGIPGRFDFNLIWTPDEFQFLQAGPRPPAPANNPDGPPDLFTAMREQLGLKLEATKGLTDVFVVDKAEKPSEN
jgi:uncharacterized protein (TIGR03435 family)